MTTSELEAFLYEQIPLAKALGVSVLQANDKSAVVRAPLAPNRNHLGTAFGGSLGAVLILSGYTWLYQAMATRGHRVHVILRKCETDYDAPVDGDLTATAFAPSDADVAKFLKTFNAKGVARVSIRAEIADAQGEPACVLRGIFVAQQGEHSRLA